MPRRLASIGAAGALLLAACTSSHPSPAGSSSPPSVSVTSTPDASSSPPPVPAGPADWPTYHGDLARTGVSASMPAAKGSPRVAKSVALDGAVYASPVVGASTIFVATENDSVYALSTTGARKWHTKLGTPSPASERPCGNIDPLGVTGTPIYDATTSTLYVAAGYGAPVRHELVAIAAATGKVLWRKGIDLSGADPTVMQQRGALTIAGGRVWVPFGGLAGDCGDYKGRVVGVRPDGSGAPIAYTVPTTREAGIWTPPGPVVDESGDLFVAVGNGESGPGDRYDYSDSVLRLDPAKATLLDSFSPDNWDDDNASDLDLGSQGPALVGDWIFIAGKSSTAYVLRRSRLGGIGGEVSSSELCRSFGGTAVVRDVVYVPCTDGVRAVRIDSTGHIRQLWHADGDISGSPVVGGGRVWSLDTGAGVLHGLDPRSGRSLGSVGVGAVSRFATPALYGTLALIPTLSGLSIVTTS